MEIESGAADLAECREACVAAGFPLVDGFVNRDCDVLVNVLRILNRADIYDTKAAVFRSGGMANAAIPAQVDTFNFASRVSIPVLMLNGDQDFIFPLETAQRPLFESLGSPEADKRHVIYEGGHGIGHRSQEIKEILDWLDRYLGPVQ